MRQRDERQSLARHRAVELGDFAVLEQQFPRPPRLVVEAIAVAVFGDVAVDQPHLVALDRRVALGDRAFALAQRLHFGAGRAGSRPRTAPRRNNRTARGGFRPRPFACRTGLGSGLAIGAQISPACASAASTARFDASEASTSGRRSSVGKAGPDSRQRIFDRRPATHR